MSNPVKNDRYGRFIDYVAADLEEKIRMSNSSSSISLGGSGAGSIVTGGSSAHGNAYHSSSSGYSISSNTTDSNKEKRLSAPNSITTSMSSQFIPTSPVHIPEIDSKIMVDLEKYIATIACDVDKLLQVLSENVQRMSAITVGCSQTYKETVERTCSTVDTSIKSMYTLMAKSEELSKAIKPFYQTSKQILEYKKHPIFGEENTRDLKSLYSPKNALDTTKV